VQKIKIIRSYYKKVKKKPLQKQTLEDLSVKSYANEREEPEALLR
jgi:hypothetical protein